MQNHLHVPAPLSPQWQQLIADEFSKDYFVSLIHKIETEYSSHTIFPPRNLWFNALNLTPPGSVKVVILGQDPYHGVGEAHGLAFSVTEGVKIPPSLRNIFKEIQAEYPDAATPENGYLERWARQGVLLLNSVLTVRKDSARSHAGMGWEFFTDAIINAVSRTRSGIVFILWGKDAASKAKLIDSSRHLILTSPHPSPLSAYRGFFGSGIFAKANSYLSGIGKTPINW